MKRTPTILECIDDRHLLGATITDPAAWRTWRTVLAAAFGLPMDVDALALYRQCTGRTEAPMTAVQFLWLIVGRRGGKSSAMAILAVYLAVFRDWRPYLRRGERAVVLLVAQDRVQAQIIHRYIAGILEAPLLSGKVLRHTAGEIELRGGVAIEVVTRDFRSVRGRSVCVAILDELAMWRSEDSANPDVEVFNSIRASMATFGKAGMVIAGSSPYSRRGVLWDAWRNWHGSENANNLVWQAPTRTMNPSVPQEFIDAEYARDEANARAEYGAEFRSDLETFLPYELIDAAVDKGRLELPYVPGRQYSAFVDPSGGGPDDYCIAIGHREGERFVIDVVRAASRPTHPHNATVQFAHLCKQYRVDRVTGDAYAGEWVQGAWKAQGVGYDVSDMSASELYLEALPLFTRRIISIPDHPKLISQLRDLERVTGNSGRDSVRHPRNQHDDFCNVVCGVSRLVQKPRLTCVTTSVVCMPGSFSGVAFR
jgi:hypothetical protein